MITQPAYFTLMVLMTTSATAIASPLINLIYDPTRPYMINKRRNIQHNPPNAELWGKRDLPSLKWVRSKEE